MADVGILKGLYMGGSACSLGTAPSLLPASSRRSSSSSFYFIYS